MASRTKDPLVGRSYLCCSGPRKGEAITVTGRAESSDRYKLEAERGGTWTISADKLRRIFGPSAKRTCQCHPLDAGVADEVVEIEESPSAETSAGPAEDENSVREENEAEDTRMVSETASVSEVIY